MTSTRDKVVLRDVDGIPVIDVTGELDLPNVGALETALQSASQKDAGAIIVSLADSTYFDSAVIHRLLMFRRKLSVNRQAFLMVKPKLEAAQRLLCIAGLNSKKETYSSLDEALAVAAQAVVNRTRT